jgi:hypothetical protein
LNLFAYPFFANNLIVGRLTHLFSLPDFVIQAGLSTRREGRFDFTRIRVSKKYEIVHFQSVISIVNLTDILSNNFEIMNVMKQRGRFLKLF